MKSPLRASEDVLSSSMQNAVAHAVATDGRFERMNFADKREIQEFEAETDDTWNVWPYSWAIAGHEIAVDRFHSFHEKLNSWHLARHNRRVLQRHRAQLQGWSCEAYARIVD